MFCVKGDLMTLISSVPNRSFDMNTQSQQAGSISSSNPTDVFSGVVRVTTGNNKTVISFCQVSSVDRNTHSVKKIFMMILNPPPIDIMKRIARRWYFFVFHKITRTLVQFCDTLRTNVLSWCNHCRLI